MNNQKRIGRSERIGFSVGIALCFVITSAKFGVLVSVALFVGSVAWMAFLSFLFPDTANRLKALIFSLLAD